jgi:hypothetical protein
VLLPVINVDRFPEVSIEATSSGIVPANVNFREDLLQSKRSSISRMCRFVNDTMIRICRGDPRAPEYRTISTHLVVMCLKHSTDRKTFMLSSHCVTLEVRLITSHPLNRSQDASISPVLQSGNGDPDAGRGQSYCSCPRAKSERPKSRECKTPQQLRFSICCAGLHLSP